MDISNLESLESKALEERELGIPEKVAVEDGRQGKPSASSNEECLARLRSFPFSQRLVAALLDEGKGHANASRSVRPTPVPEPAWHPKDLAKLTQFNRILENRVKAELQAVGLLDPHDDDELYENMRLVSIKSTLILCFHFILCCIYFIHTRYFLISRF